MLKVVDEALTRAGLVAFVAMLVVVCVMGFAWLIAAIWRGRKR